MKNLASLLFLVVATSSCGVVSQATYEGATAGALGGSVAGAMLDKDNAWRGAVIGGAIGAFLGASLTEVAVRASSDGRQKGCTLVRTSYYKNGKIEKVEERKVCD